MKSMHLLMRWLLPVCLISAVLTPVRAQVHPANKTDKPGTVVLLSMHDALQPVSAATLQAQLHAAAAKHPAAILLALSTPGGLRASAEAMAQAIAASPVPVVVYVRSPGTHVSGEGLRLLQAGAAAVMHPDTRLVPLRRDQLRAGSGREHDEEIRTLDHDMRENLQRKGTPTAIFDDLLSSRDGLTSQQSLAAGLVDAVATRDEDALRALESRLRLRSNGAASSVNLHDAYVVEQPLSIRQNLMRALMNPNLTVLLLTLGALLIYLEINTPGAVIPGAAGLLLVLLSAYSLLQMPLRWQGVVLLLLSALLLFAEAQSPRGSAYGVGAVIGLTLGLRLLVRGPIPELEVNWSTSVGAGVGFGGITASLILLGVRARRAKVKTGAEAMLGWLAITQTPLEPAGEVLVRGELWRARLADAKSTLQAGECVKVQSSDGMTLEVAPVPLTIQLPPPTPAMAG